MSVSWTSHARELQRSVFPSLSFGASAGPSLKSTTRTTRTISLTQKDIQKCFVLASSTTGVFSPWRPASSKAVVRCTLQKTDKKLTEADVEANTLKYMKHDETWLQIITQNQKKQKQQNSTHCCMLLTTSPTSMIWSVPVTSFNGLLHLSFSCSKLTKTSLPELEFSQSPQSRLEAVFRRLQPVWQTVFWISSPFTHIHSKGHGNGEMWWMWWINPHLCRHQMLIFQTMILSFL